MQASLAGSMAKVAPSRAATPRVPIAAAKVVPRRAVVAQATAEEVKQASTNGAGKATALDFDELTELIKMVHSTDIVELELNSKKFKLSVKKKEALEMAEPQIVHVQAPAAAYAAPAPAPAAAAPAAAPTAPAPRPAVPAPAAAPAAAPVDGVEVASPMAGTFYRSPAPGEPAFVKEGDHVTKGQTICIVEEIEADATGTLVKIVAENGKPVTPGQTLMIIKP